MKTKLYTLVILLLCTYFGKAQPCSGLQISYITKESRCVATGSIEVFATGGSGNYNYRVTGPVNTPLTSANLITGLQPGFYNIVVNDLAKTCTTTLDSVYVPGTYDDPRFVLIKRNVSCLGNDGSIAVANQEFGRSPFTYTIIAPSPSGVGSSNSSGSFNNLIAGEYAVELRDSCGGIQVRRVTIENYVWWIDSSAVNRISCDSADVFIRLRNNRGQANTTGGFNGFVYGLVRAPGDTVFSNNPGFRAFIGAQTNATLIAKDNCGNIQTANWTLPANQRPTVGPAALSNFGCSSFNVTLPVKQNLTNPRFCLYNPGLVACNSTGSFSNLPYGSYCIRVTDQCYDTTISVCFNVAKPQPAVDAAVNISNQNCSSFTASITGGVNLINPTYCILDRAGVTLDCNSTGVFTNLPYGYYCIETTNGCGDTTITRCFRASRPPATLNTPSISGRNCTSFNVNVGGSNLFNANFCLYDSTGQIIACDSNGTFNGIPYGSYCIRAVRCGDTTAAVCFSSGRPVPSVAGSVQISNKNCNGFTATITGQTNITAPQYCLYNSSDSLLGCNTTGVFTNIAYGSYCIKLKDSCTDSTIVRCFAASRAIPSINNNVNQTNSGCSGLTATVTGSNLTSPEYCLLDALGNVVSCNTTGVFNNVPWGSWCFRIKDGCTDTVMTVCKTFTRPMGINLSTSKACKIGSANINVHFSGGFWPFNIKIYKQDGTLAADTTTNVNPFSIALPGLPSGEKYRVVGTDGCGFKDSATVTPDASAVLRSITVNAKCPSATWQNGAGELVVNCSSNLYTVTPTVVRKNGTAFNQSFSSVSGTQFRFADLEPATYVVEYNMTTCNSKVYDTVVVTPYTFPTQGQSAIYQCDNNTLSLGANVQGGIGPYSYQIIGSTPAAPSIATGVQSSPVFTINTGTIYSLVRMRAIDACGNATLDDVSVLPLQNFSVTASQLCFFQGVRLSVNEIPNAVYTWYRKTTPTDSVLLGSGASYNLPFFVPEEIGQYVCYINVHGGCAKRRATFTLDGNCGNVVLPAALRFTGKKRQRSHQLSWQLADEQGVSHYSLERKKEGETAFQTIARFNSAAANAGAYSYDDASGFGFRCQYRIKVHVQQGRYAYSQVVSLQSHTGTRVYPNPVREKLTLQFDETRQADYLVQLYDAGGRVVYAQTIRQAAAYSNVSIATQAGWGKGMYLLRITNKQTAAVETHTIVLH